MSAKRNAKALAPEIPELREALQVCLALSRFDPDGFHERLVDVPAGSTVIPVQVTAHVVNFMVPKWARVDKPLERRNAGGDSVFAHPVGLRFREPVTGDQWAPVIPAVEKTLHRLVTLHRCNPATLESFHAFRRACSITIPKNPVEWQRYYRKDCGTFFDLEKFPEIKVGTFTNEWVDDGWAFCGWEGGEETLFTGSDPWEAWSVFYESFCENHTGPRRD